MFETSLRLRPGSSQDAPGSATFVLAPTFLANAGISFTMAPVCLRLREIQSLSVHQAAQQAKSASFGMSCGSLAEAGSACHQMSSISNTGKMQHICHLLNVLRLACRSRHCLRQNPLPIQREDCRAR